MATNKASFSSTSASSVSPSSTSEIEKYIKSHSSGGRSSAFLAQKEYWDAFIMDEVSRHYNRIEKYLETKEKIKSSASTVFSGIGDLAEKEASKAKDSVTASIADALLDDITSLAISEGKSLASAASSTFGQAEEEIIAAVAQAVDERVSPIVNDVKDSYYTARNFLFDQLENSLSTIVDTVKTALGQTREIPKTVYSNGEKGTDPSKSYEIKNPTAAVQSATEQIKEALLAVSAAGTLFITRGFQTKGLPDDVVVAKPAFLDFGTQEDFESSLPSLMRETRAVIDSVSQIIARKLVTNGGKELSPYVLMGLMDRTKSRVYAYDYLSRLLATNSTIGKMTKTVNDFRPSNIIKSALYGKTSAGQAEVLSALSRDMLNGTQTTKPITAALMDKARKYINDISTKAYVQMTGFNQSEGSKKFSPDPIWGDMTKDFDIFSPKGLMKSFRANKTFLGGEVDYFESGFTHFFFVKPDLNLTENAIAGMDLAMGPMLGDLITNLNYNNNDLAEYWGNFPYISDSYSGTNPFFSYLLSNMIKNVPLTDLSLDTKDAWENVKGSRMSYGLTHLKGTYSGEVPITYLDTKNLFITNLIQMWVKYITLMKEGIGECRPKNKNMFSIDYLGAIYIFVTEPDGASIAHWSRYTGVYPTSVPWSTISTSQGSQEIPEFSVNMKYQFYETNDVNILRDFNYIMNGGPASSRNYWELCSIPEINSFISHADATLRSSPIAAENRAIVSLMPLTGEDGGISRISPTSSLGQFKFVLDFVSTDDFLSLTKNATSSFKSKPTLRTDSFEGNTVDVAIGSVNSTKTYSEN
jgi:hypothetical protein